MGPAPCFMGRDSSMDETTSFGAWMRRRRKLLDLTQDELARRVGCTRSTIQKIEGDERRPSREIAARLADLLEVPPEQRAAVVKAARAELAIDRLSRTGPTLASAAPPTTLETDRVPCPVCGVATPADRR